MKSNAPCGVTLFLPIHTMTKRVVPFQSLKMLRTLTMVILPINTYQGTDVNSTKRSKMLFISFLAEKRLNINRN